LVEDDFSIELSEDDDSEQAEGSGLTASGIAEYIRFKCCPRFFKLKFEGKESANAPGPKPSNPSARCFTAPAKRLKRKK
jgi:hypothetical protein